MTDDKIASSREVDDGKTLDNVIKCVGKVYNRRFYGGIYAQMRCYRYRFPGVLYASVAVLFPDLKR